MIAPTKKTPEPLTDAQRLVLSTIAQYYVATGEPCSLSYLARRLGRSRNAIRGHLEALHRKGWIPAPAIPGTVEISQ
jgi:predicted ArsR family transcriptional regulator